MAISHNEVGKSNCYGMFYRWAVLHLALKYGDFFKAGIGLQSATHAESNLNEKLGLLMIIPCIGQICMAEKSPLQRCDKSCHQVRRRKNIGKLFGTTHKGAGGFLGDLNYYFEDGDMRNGIAEQQIPKNVQFIFTGEYDLFAPEIDRGAGSIDKCSALSGYERDSGIFQCPKIMVNSEIISCQY